MAIDPVRLLLSVGIGAAECWPGDALYGPHWACGLRNDRMRVAVSYDVIELLARPSRASGWVVVRTQGGLWFALRVGCGSHSGQVMHCG